MNKNRVGQPVTIGETTIIPIESYELYGRSGNNTILFDTKKKPIGIVIITPVRRWAIDMDGEDVPLEDWISEIEGLKQVIESV